MREYISGEQEKFLTTHHERDVETGLDYRGARFYDADVARFLSLDPLAKKFEGWSPYNYVISNPNKYIDFTGKGPDDPIKTFYASAKINTGEFGLKANLGGLFGVGYTHADGSLQLSVKLHLDVYSDKSKAFGISFSATEILSKREGSIAHISGGQTETKERKLDINTKDGVKYSKDDKFVKEETAGVGAFSISNNKATLEGKVEIGSGVVGAGASAGYEEPRNATSKNSEDKTKKNDSYGVVVTNSANILNE